jgi:GGDEF domain-containing protein
VGRLGPESFAIVLPGAKPNQLAAVRERILVLAAGGSCDDHISFSIGGAFYPEDGDGAHNLLEVAQRRARSSQAVAPGALQALADSVQSPAVGVSLSQ